MSSGSTAYALVGQYRLKQWLGAGPDGASFAASSEEGRAVEVRRIDESLVHGAHRQRLVRLQSIEHEALLRVLDVGTSPAYVVVDRLASTWDDASKRPASQAALVEAMRTLAFALAEAHAASVIHGALAPGDVGTTSAGKLVLDLTRTRTSPAEPFPIAPELEGGAPPTAAADVWSLGAVLERAMEPIGALSGAIASLLAEMKREDPEARPRARQIFERLDVTMVAPEEAIEPIVAERLPRRLGTYELTAAIGAGGMGQVFRAHDVATGAPVALKLLGRQWGNDPDAVARFRREARILALLSSPHVARFIEANEVRGLHFLAMELVDGRDAKSLLRKNGPMAVEAAVSIAVCVARALGEMHALGLVHRDVKPTNILVPSDADLVRPLVKLCDFGIARARTEEQNLTMGGTPGTPSYMAPEQINGELADARTDVYALGVTLFELLIGQPPFVGEAPAVMLAHVLEPVPDLRKRRPDVPEEVAAIVHRAMSKKPDERFEDATQLLGALEATRRGEIASGNALPQPHSLEGTPIVYDAGWELSSSPAELWPHVSNTERLNRAIGLDDVQWSHAPQESGGVVREGQFRAAGMTLRWKENPFEWVAPHRLGVVREYSSGPFEWLRSTVQLTPREAGGTTLRHTIEIRPRGLFGRLAAGVEVGLRMRRALERVYRHIDESCRRARDGTSAVGFDPFEDPGEIDGDAARRLEAILAKVAAAGADPYSVEALRRFVRTAPAPRLSRIRPKEWAHENGLDERDALATLLRAAFEGALVTLWDILCPVCRIPGSIHDSLKRLSEHGHCDACNLDFELDLARSVELVFRVHPDLRSADVGMYCIGGPAHSPHVMAQVRLAPAQRIALDLALPEGSYRIAGRGLPSEWSFRVHRKAAHSSWEVPIAAGLAPGVPHSLKTGPQRVVLSNDLDRELVVRIESAADRALAFTAAEAASSSLFRALFPHELLSPEQLVTVSKVALLFVESADAPTRYLGGADRESYQDLCELLVRVREAAELEGGALVKLHGEAVLAVFTAAAPAVRAGLRVMTSAAVRGSVHAGPAMMTTIQDRLDYFGRTVYCGAALLRMGGPGELLVSDEVTRDPSAAAVLQSDGRESGVVTLGPFIATRIRTGL